MKKEAFLLLLVSVGMMILLPPVRGDAPKPVFSTSDMWKYNITSAGSSSSSAGGSFTGTITQTIGDIETVNVSGQDYQCYKIDLSGSGTFIITSGPATGSASFTLTGASYWRVSDLADVKDSISVIISTGFVSVTISDSVLISPPIQYYNFPLSVGKTWTSTSYVTESTTAPGIGGGSMTTTNSSTTFSSFFAERMDRVTVPAGAFQAYVIKQNTMQTFSSGNSNTISLESYYSPMAGNIVKGNLPIGGSPFTVELVDYTAHPYHSSVSVSNAGQSYNIGLSTNVEATAISSNSTAITFNVNDVGTGKALVRIPAGLNNTAVTVYEDSGIISSTSTKNGTEYDVRFNFALSQHRISIVYTKPPSGLAFVIGLLTNPYSILGFIIVAASVAAVAAVLEHRRRRPTAPSPQPSETGPGADGSPSPPVPSPPTESPAPPQSTNN